MRKRDIAKKVVVTFFDVVTELVANVLKIVAEITVGLLKTIGLILGLLYAPEETGDVVVASRQRKQRRRIDALEAEIEELKKSQ